MKKYTIQQIKDQKLAVNCHSYEEGEEISKALQSEWYEKYWKLVDMRWFNSINFSIFNHSCSSLGWVPNDKEPNYYVKNNIATAYIDFNQVIFEEEFVLPEKWCVCPRTEENLEFIKQWSKMYSRFILSYPDNAYTSNMQYYTHVGEAVNAGYKEIKFEEFKQHVLKEQQTMENKIIGYNLIKPEFKKAASLIAHEGTFNNTGFTSRSPNHPYDFVINSLSYNKIKNAGVLDLWFEPVYEEDYKVGDWIYIINDAITMKGDCGKGNIKQIKSIEASPDYEYRYIIEYTDGAKSSARLGMLRKATPEEIEKVTTKTIRMGGADGFDLTVKDGKVYHKSEDITDYVNNVNKEFGSFINNHKMNSNLDFTISDMIIAKSGCESKKTMLSEWVNIYKLINT